MPIEGRVIVAATILLSLGVFFGILASHRRFGLSGRSRAYVWRAVVILNSICVFSFVFAAISLIASEWTFSICPCGGKGPCCSENANVEFAGRSSSEWLWLVSLIAAFIWATGTAWRLGKLLLGWRLVRQWVNSAQQLNDPWRWAPNSTVALKTDWLESLQIKSPFATGILRSSILVPTDAWANYSDTERRLVVAHELAHASSNDVSWTILAHLVRAFIYFHPAVSIVCAELQVAQELAADEKAIEWTGMSRAAYARTLWGLLAHRSVVESDGILFAASSMQGALARRMMALAQIEQTRLDRLHVIGLLTAVALPSIVIGYFWATPDFTIEPSIKSALTMKVTYDPLIDPLPTDEPMMSCR